MSLIVTDTQKQKKHFVTGIFDGSTKTRDISYGEVIVHGSSAANRSACHQNQGRVVWWFQPNKFSVLRGPESSGARMQKRPKYAAPSNRLFIVNSLIVIWAWCMVQHPQFCYMYITKLLLILSNEIDSSTLFLLFVSPFQLNTPYWSLLFVVLSAFFLYASLVSYGCIPTVRPQLSCKKCACDSYKSLALAEESQWLVSYGASHRTICSCYVSMSMIVYISIKFHRIP